MQAFKLHLKPPSADEQTSKMFAPILIPDDLDPAILADYEPVLQLNIAELPENPLPFKDGWLQFFIRDEGFEADIFLIHIDKNCKTKRFPYPQAGFDVTIKPTKDREGIKLFGQPYQLNLETDPDHIILFQFDPYADERIRFFNTLDGFLYVMIDPNALEEASLHLAYTILDYT